MKNPLSPSQLTLWWLFDLVPAGNESYARTMFDLMKLELHEIGHVAPYFTMTLEFKANSAHLKATMRVVWQQVVWQQFQL